MNRKFLLTLPFILSLICFTAYTLIGQSVAADGTLVESFAFVPLGYLFFNIGIIVWAVQFGKIFLSKKKSGQ